MNSDILMKDVTMGEKVFVKYGGAILQAKVVGFETKNNLMCGGNNHAEYTLYMGDGNTLQLNRTNFGYDDRIYRTVADVIDGKPIETVQVSPGDFTKAYMNGLCMEYNGKECSGYVWQHNSVCHCIIASGRPQVRHLNGETTFVGGNPDPKRWFQIAEECRTHNAAKVIYLNE